MRLREAYWLILNDALGSSMESPAVQYDSDPDPFLCSGINHKHDTVRRRRFEDHPVKKAKRILIISAALLVAGIVALNVIGYCTGSAYLFAASARIDTYEVRSQLLEDAMREVGAASAEKAADIWASGLEKRSAALQYSVMSNDLKEQYAKELERRFPNWVTGMSSPWVDSYAITKTMSRGEERIFYLSFHTMTSTGSAGDYHAILDITREDGYWRIQKIEMDKALTPYTGSLSKLNAN